MTSMASLVNAISEPDVELAERHLERLFAPARKEYPGGLIELRWGRDGAVNNHAYFGMSPERIADAVEFAASCSRAGCNVYVGVNPRKPTTNTRKAASAADIEIAFWHFADLDKAEAVATATERLAALHPTFTVTTGTTPHKRPHFYWLLEEPVRNLTAWTDRQRGIMQSLAGDPVIDPPRIMRLAGTINWPPPHKLARGYAVERVTLRTQFAEERGPYAPEQIAAAYPLRDRAAGTSGKSPPGATTTLSTMRRTQVADLLAACCSGDGWHNAMIRLVGHLAAKGRADAEILALAEHITLPGYAVEQTRQEMQTALAGARSKWSLPEPEEEAVPEAPPREQSAADDGTASKARRAAQRAENVEIGEGSNVVPTARLYKLPEMLEQFVFIKDGSQVAPLDRPQAVLSFTDFKNATAASRHVVMQGERTKSVPAALAWLESPERMEAETLTFRAGGARITIAPNSGKRALNLWTPIGRPPAPDDWQQLASLFVEHIRWLWGDDADVFLDWLAHIEQQPGVLPHYGWVHISREHGKGRNWISSVLTRLWPGHVAASLDLVAILEGGFNGRMSRKLLAIVDEINEGGNTSYRHAQTLRQLVTAEHREINPKYGRQHVEYNACRWLMFSNHTGAIPLGEDDRRFWIVSHQGEPHPPAYYTALYHQLGDPLFIASVAEFLKRRDVSGFKPGERPPMNAAKAELVAFGQTEDDLRLREIVTRWPVDLITAYELTNLLEEGGPSRPAVRHAMDRAGIRRLGDGKVRLHGQGPQRVYALRDLQRWLTASYDEKATEISRKTDAEKRDALESDESQS